MLGYDIGHDAEMPAHLEPKCDEEHERCSKRFGCAAGWPFADQDEEATAKMAGTYQAIVDNFMHPREEQQ